MDGTIDMIATDPHPERVCEDVDALLVVRMISMAFRIMGHSATHINGFTDPKTIQEAVRLARRQAYVSELCRKRDAHSLRVLAVLFGGATLKAVRFIVLVMKALESDALRQLNGSSSPLPILGCCEVPSATRPRRVGGGGSSLCTVLPSAL